jgi:hypothetical protein
LSVALTFSILCSTVFSVFAQPIEPYFAEYQNLGYHGLDNLFSSLNVSGTVVLYDDYDLKSTAHNIPFTETSVANLINHRRGSSDNWDNVIKSLKVIGTVTLCEHPNWKGRTATFTSNNLSYDDIGTEWSRNPNLLKNNDSWDPRTWNWLPGISNIYHEDENNYVNWNHDGLVESRALDGGSDLCWKAMEFDQGEVRYQNEIYDLGAVWNNMAASLQVEGSVTLYDGIGYAGESVTFTDSDVPNLGFSNWSYRASSLKLSKGSRVTLYDLIHYQGLSISFEYPSYQPPGLKVSDKSSITLEGVVENWYTDSWTQPGWTGVKFDIYATENPNSSSAKTLMLELYFVRDGCNLAWGNGFCRDPFLSVFGDYTYNVLLALDCWPQYVQRTVYPGNVAKWTIDIKAIIQRACNHNWWPWSSPDFDKLSIVKIGFTVETAYRGAGDPNGAGCSLNRLRLAYKDVQATSNKMWLEPSSIDITGRNTGYKFNVTVWANLNAPSFTWQTTMHFDPTFLRATRVGYTSGSTSQFFAGHSTIPVTSIVTNSAVSTGESLQGSDSRPPGNGSLCWVELELIVPASGTILNIDNDDTFYLDGDLNEIVCTKSGTYASSMGLKLSVSSAHGSPSPFVGDCYYDNGTSVTCSVVSPVTEDATIWNCTGWTGTGSVPPIGEGTSVTLNVAQDSSIAWRWTQLTSSVHLESVQNNAVTSNLGTITLDTSPPNIESYPASAIWIEPAFIDVTGKSAGSKLNVTAWANLSTASFTWQVTMYFNSTCISCTRIGYTSGSTSQFFAGHSTIPVTPIIMSNGVSTGESLVGTDKRPVGHGSLCWFELELILPGPYLPNTTVLGIDNSDTFCLTGDLNEIASTKYNAYAATNLYAAYNLPNDAQTPIGTYSVLYNPRAGYGFDHWESTGGVIVSDADASQTTVTVSGLGGALRAIYVRRSLYDINNDLVVDMKDISIAASAFDTVPGNPRWKPEADINGPTGSPDGRINLMDIALIARHFQERYS